MAKRREARHDPLEMVIPTAHWPIGGALAAAAVTAMEISAASGVTCRTVGSKTAFAEITERISQRAARPPAWLPRSRLRDRITVEIGVFWVLTALACLTKNVHGYRSTLSGG